MSTTLASDIKHAICSSDWSAPWRIATGKYRNCLDHSDGVFYKDRGREADSTATSESIARTQDTDHLYIQLICATEIRLDRQVTTQALHSNTPHSPTPSDIAQSQGTPATLAQPDSTSPSTPPCRSCAYNAVGTCWHGHACVPRSKASRQLASQSGTVSTKGADSLRYARLRRGCEDDCCFEAGLPG